MTPAQTIERLRAKRLEACVSGPGWDICDDCERKYRMERDFMVTDDIWASIGAAEYGCLLCIECVEKRLGRALEIDDFIPWPVNEGLVPDDWWANMYERQAAYRKAHP